jgi:hypothetical protein
MVELERNLDELIAKRLEKSRLSGASSITAALMVCMCTFGVSLYSSTASHPLSRFTAAPCS